MTVILIVGLVCSQLFNISFFMLNLSSPLHNKNRFPTADEGLKTHTSCTYADTYLVFCATIQKVTSVTVYSLLNEHHVTIQLRPLPKGGKYVTFSIKCADGTEAHRPC